MIYRQTIFEEWTHAHEAARRGRKTSALSVFALAHLDMILRVELKAELADEIELRFEEIDVVFLVRHQLLGQVACHKWSLSGSPRAKGASTPRRPDSRRISIGNFQYLATAANAFDHHHRLSQCLLRRGGQHVRGEDSSEI